MKRGSYTGTLLVLLLVVSGGGACGDDDGGGDNSNSNLNENSNDNNNSSPGCGNGVREGDETCDGTDVGAETCEGRGFHGGLLLCNDDCSYDETNCELVGWCGDGLVQSAWEVCDSTLMYPPACEDLGLGYDGGTVGCAADCTYDESSCSVCGNLVVEGIEVCDEDDDVVRDGCHHCLATEFPVADATGLVPFAPSVAFGPDGEFVVTYTTMGTGALTSYVQRFDAQGLVDGAAVFLSSVGHLDGVHEVVFDPAGRLLTVWVRQDSVPTLMAQYLDAGGQPDATPFVVAENPGGDILLYLSPAVSINSSGEFVVAFVAEGGTLTDGDGLGVFARRFTGLGVPVGGVFPVNTTTVDDQALPSVAIASDGRFLVVWDNYNSTTDTHQAHLQRFDAQGAADGVEVDLTAGVPSIDFVTYPKVTMAPDGRAVVMWARNLSVSGYVYETLALRLDATFSVDGTEILVDASPGMRASNGVAMAADGAFMLLWGETSPDLEISMVRSRRYNALGAPIGPVFQMSATGFYFDEFVIPAIGMAPGGNVAVAWSVLNSHAVEDSRFVYALRYDAQGRAYSVNPW